MLTIEARSLTREHLAAAGVREVLPLAIQELEEVGGFLSRQTVENQMNLEIERCAVEHEQSACRLVDRNPNVGATVLEFTTMTTYAHRIGVVTVK